MQSRSCRHRADQVDGEGDGARRRRPRSPRQVEQTSLDGLYDGSHSSATAYYLVVHNDTSVPRPSRAQPEPDPDAGAHARHDAGSPRPCLRRRPCRSRPCCWTPGAASPSPDRVRRRTTTAVPPDGSGSDPGNSGSTPAAEVYESEAAYRARLEAMPLSDLLPGYTSDASGQTTSGSLITAADTYVRDLSAGVVGQNLTTLALLNLGDDAGGPTATSTVAGYGGTIYASTDSFYLASTQWADTGGETTEVFKFDMGTDSVPLLASGQVEGSVLDQFSMDESGDYFRIATNGWSGDTSPAGTDVTSSVSVLTQSGEELDLVGRVKNIAKGESLQSARFVGDQAYVVTFHQIDPLFVVDLSNPTAPRVAGQLDLPGYSSYLQPIGNDLLLGLGRDVDADTGQDHGLQVSLFDVSNPAAPQRLAKFSPGEAWSYSEAEYDHHAFSYFSDQQILALPVDHCAALR